MEKHSALLQVKGEDQLGVDADHRDLCRFKDRSDATYEKLYRRLNRMLEAKTVVLENISALIDHCSFMDLCE